MKDSKSGHVFETHTNCTKVYCSICDGGLEICTVCGGAEGSLTTFCPGHKLTVEYLDLVYMSKLDCDANKQLYWKTGMTQEKKTQEFPEAFVTFFTTKYGVHPAHWARANTQCRKQVEMCFDGWKDSDTLINGLRLRVMELKEDIKEMEKNRP